MSITLKQITVTVKDDARQEDIDAFIAHMVHVSRVYNLDAVMIYDEKDVEEDTIRVDDQKRTRLVEKARHGKT